MKMLPKKRVLISHQGCVPIYRKGLFDRLATNESTEYVVAYGAPPRGTDYIVAQEPYQFPTIKISNEEVGVLGKSLIWQKGIVSAFRSGFDAVVLGEEVKYISHSVLIALCKVTRKPVILWGFGYQRADRGRGSKNAFRKLIVKFGRMFRNFLVSQVDGYLVYTPSGAATLSKEGFNLNKTRVVYNTVDVDKERGIAQQVAQTPLSESYTNLRIRENIPSLLYFGRFLPLKKIDLLIDYGLRREKLGTPVNIILFGAGAEENNLRERASSSSHIVFHKHDDLLLGDALRVSEAVVIPGFIGLAITHCFAHGVPIITRSGQSHSPEFDYLIEGKNGLVLEEDSEVFFEQLDKYLSDPLAKATLKEGAQESGSQMTMDRMAENFADFVEQTIAKRTGSSRPAGGR